MRILVISAHPDDEVIGAGGTISRHVKNGDEVYWCIVTQSYSPPWPKETCKIMQEQTEAVQKCLGIKQKFHCGFPTVKLNTVPYIDLTSSLQKVVDEVRPEIVYTTPPNDINQDHRIVYDASIVAVRPLPGSSVRRVLCYEIGPTSRYGTIAFEPNVFVDITEHLDKKLQAMACYKQELREFPHPRSLEGLKILAQERGLSVGVRAAECFQLVREVL